MGPPVKRQLNGVLLVGRWCPNIECCLDQYYTEYCSRSVLIRNPIALLFARMGSGPTASLPPPIFIGLHVRIQRSREWCYTALNPWKLTKPASIQCWAIICRLVRRHKMAFGPLWLHSIIAMNSDSKLGKWLGIAGLYTLKSWEPE